MSVVGLTEVRHSRTAASSVSPLATSLRIPLRSSFPVRKLVLVQSRTQAAVRGCACFALLSFAFATAENTRFFSQHFEEDFLSVVLRSMSLLFAGLLVLFLVKYYQCRLATRKAFNSENASEDSVWTQRDFRGPLLMEIAVAVLVLPPNMNEVINVRALGKNARISMDDVFYPFHICRLYHILRLLFSESSLNSSKGIFRLSVSKVRIGLNFYIHSLVFSHYVLFAFTVLCLLALGGGLLVLIFERTMEQSALTEYKTAVYCAGVSMATIGYGDVLPNSHLGRGILILVGILGNYAQAVLNLGVASSTTLTSSELRLAAEINLKQYRERELRLSAIVYIQRWWRLRFMRKYHRPSRFKLLNLLRHSRVAFEKKLVKANEQSGLVFAVSVENCCKNFDKAFSAVAAHLHVDKRIMKRSSELVSLCLKTSRDINALRRRIVRCESTQKTVALRREGAVGFLPRLSSSSITTTQRRKAVFDRVDSMSNLHTRKAMYKVIKRRTERIISEGSGSSIEM